MHSQMGVARLTEEVDRLPLLSWEEYAGFAASKPPFPTLTARPDVPNDASFGLNLIVDGEIRSYALVPSSEDDATLYPDTDGSGVIDDGPGWALTSTFVERSIGTGETRYPAAFRVVRKRRSWVLEVRSQQERRGTLELNGISYGVLIRGYEGNYDGPGAFVVVDLDGDGVFKDGPLSKERFDFGPDGNVVVLEGQRFALSVGPGGKSLTWTPEAASVVTRPSVELGAVAPEFPAGPGPTLAAMHGNPVVVEFFSPGCAYCAAPGRELREASEELMAQGVQVISVEQTDSGEGQAYATEHGKTWPVVVGERGAAIASLYRVREVPTFVAIDADGVLCARGTWQDLGPAIRSGRPCDLTQALRVLDGVDAVADGVEDRVDIGGVDVLPMVAEL